MDEENPDCSFSRDEALQNHVGTGKKIRIERDFPSNPDLNGYLLELSPLFGLMHCFHDFMPDGYTVFRVVDVTACRSGKYERHWDRMLAGEGLLAGLKVDWHVDLSSMKMMLESISNQFQRMIIECEEQGEDAEDFYIGQISSAGESETRFHHFDALGFWEEEPAVIPYREIPLIQFETPYLKIFRAANKTTQAMRISFPRADRGIFC